MLDHKRDGEIIDNHIFNHNSHLDYRLTLVEFTVCIYCHKQPKHVTRHTGVAQNLQNKNKTLVTQNLRVFIFIFRQSALLSINAFDGALHTQSEIGITPKSNVILM